MGRITVNPNAEANAAFDIVKPGVYQMRIQGSETFAAVQEFTAKSGNQCIKVRLVYADPTACYKEDGNLARTLGSIIDSSIVIAPAEKQGKLRSVVESAGLSWTDFDTEDLASRELSVKIGVELDQNGEKRNFIQRYLKAA